MGLGAEAPVAANDAALDPEPASATLEQLLAEFNAGRFPQAEALARDLVAANPDLGLAWKLLGAALWRQGRDPLPAFETAARLLPDDMEAHSNLGNVLRARRRPDAAAICHRRATELNPASPEAHNNLGSALLDLGQLDDAITCYRRALSLMPDFAMAHNNLGIALRLRGRPEEALASHRRALVMQPDFADAHVRAADALLELGRREEAAESYARAIALQPRPEWLNAWGNVLWQLRRLSECAAAYRRALELQPRSPDALNNLGNALRDLGQLEEAVACYGRALELEPAVPEVHNNLGNALLDQGRAEDAVRSYERALELKPGSGKAYSNRGSAYLEIGNLEAAESSYRQALEIQSDAADIWVNLGAVQRLRLQSEAADESCRRALELSPQLAAAWVLRGDLLADRGEFDAAEAAYREALQLDPGRAAAWAGLVALRKWTDSNADVGSTLESLAMRPQRSHDEAHLRFALGKYYDDVRNFSAAFENFRRANELKKRARPPYDGLAVTRAYDGLIEAYDPAWAAADRSASNASERPVFIVGMPRSGTSLAEQILASHAAVYGAGELPFWQAAATQFGNCAEPATLRDLAERYLATLAGLDADAARVIDKMPGNFAHLGLIHGALPRARIIHMRRDPIDTCLSIYFQNFNRSHNYANDLDDLAHYYAEYRRLMNHWQAVLPAGALLEVPYESLVEDPERWSRRMVEFIGLPWDPQCLEFHRTARQVSTFSKWQVRQKISRASVARWRNYAGYVEPLLALSEAAPGAA